MKKYLFYPTVVFTKGITRTLLLDILRSTIHFIPNSVVEEIVSGKFKGFDETSFESEWLTFFLENDLIFEVDSWEVDCFPKIGLEYKDHKEISHIIMRLSAHCIEYFDNLNIFPCDCHYYFILDQKIKDYAKFFEFLNNHESDMLELGVINEEFLIDQTFISELKKLKKFVLINNLTNIDNKNEPFGSIQGGTIYLKEKNELPITITKSFRHYSEAQKHHTYFNKKVFIDEYGMIKKSFSDTTVFGQISSLDEKVKEDLLNNSKFNSIWNVRKEHIDICKDCEFRNVCVDNRVPINRNDNEWFHQENCGYNPYISKMSDEVDYKTPSEVGVASNENGFTIDSKLINSINEELWGE